MIACLDTHLLDSWPGPTKAKTSGAIVKIDEDNYKLEYVPKEIGRFKIDVFSFDKPIWSNPTTVEVYDPHRIRVSSVSTCLKGKVCELTGTSEAALAFVNLQITFLV